MRGNLGSLSAFRDARAEPKNINAERLNVFAPANKVADPEERVAGVDRRRR